jgi:hypothetical protein
MTTIDNTRKLFKVSNFDGFHTQTHMHTCVCTFSVGSHQYLNANKHCDLTSSVTKSWRFQRRKHNIFPTVKNLWRQHMIKVAPQDILTNYLQTCIRSRMVSSGMLHRVALVKTDVSEEPGASFIRVTRIGELGRTQAATSNWRTLQRNTKVASCSLCCS